VLNPLRVALYKASLKGIALRPGYERRDRIYVTAPKIYAASSRFEWNRAASAEHVGNFLDLQSLHLGEREGLGRDEGRELRRVGVDSVQPQLAI
jgi:hypothetical protein